jgi:hypothetical protein
VSAAYVTDVTFQDDSFVEYFPTDCTSCGESVSITDCFLTLYQKLLCSDIFVVACHCCYRATRGRRPTMMPTRIR